MDSAAPIEASQRSDLIDALRGFALAGVLLVNLRYFSLYELLDESTLGALPTADWDRVLNLFVIALVDAKAMTLFALLFGVGFAMQLDRAAGDVQARRRYAWRLTLLLGIGLLNAWLLWYGDILRYYALFGLLLLPLARCSAQTLAWLGAFVAIVATALLQPVMKPWRAMLAPNEVMNSVTYAALAGTDAIAALKANFRYDLWMHATAWSLPFFTLGRLLIGMAIGRAGLLQDPQTHRAQWKRLLAWSLPTGAVLTVYFLLRDYGGLAPDLFGLTGDTARALSRLLRNTSYLALGLAYMAGFVLLFQHARSRRWLAWLAPMGRMALTLYLSQAAFGVTLFYGVGFGLAPRYGLPAILLAFVAIFAAQAVFSHAWLRRYRFGPLEWLWRCLTYRRRLPLRHAPAIRPDAEAASA